MELNLIDISPHYSGLHDGNVLSHMVFDMKGKDGG
jgi:hypothetical protein